MTEYTDEQIRDYAHHLWEKAGRPEGRSEEFWHQAVTELEANGGAIDPGDQPNATIIPG